MGVETSVLNVAPVIVCETKSGVPTSSLVQQTNASKDTTGFSLVGVRQREEGHVVAKKLKLQEAEACGSPKPSAEMACVVEGNHADESIVAEVKTADTTV